MCDCSVLLINVLRVCLRILPDLISWREVCHLSPLSGSCYGLVGKQWNDREEFDLNKSFNSQETCDTTREECEKRMKEGAETIQRKREPK